MATRNSYPRFSPSAFLLAGVVVWAQIGLALAVEEKGDAGELVTRRIEGAKLSVAVPKAWVFEEIVPESKDDAARYSGFRLFCGKDKESIMFALMRDGQALPAGTDAAKFANDAVAESRKHAKENDAKIIDERDLSVGELPGRSLEFEYLAKDVPCRMFSVVFVRNGKKYTAVLGGERVEYLKHKPTVIKIIVSIKWIE